MALFLFCTLAILLGCNTEAQETDEQLLAKLDPALSQGTFHNHTASLSALSVLVRRANPKVMEPAVVDCLISSGALLLDDDGSWTDRREARKVYDTLELYDDDRIIQGLVRKVINDPANRLHVLFLGVKLGIPNSEDRLNQVLDQHGDKRMAEDFLNSDSAKLYEGGKAWANSRGYHISTGMGSHRASWGRF